MDARKQNYRQTGHFPFEGVMPPPPLFNEEDARYQDPLTGAHFNFEDVCNRLLFLQQRSDYLELWGKANLNEELLSESRGRVLTEGNEAPRTANKFGQTQKVKISLRQEARQAAQPLNARLYQGTQNRHSSCASEKARIKSGKPQKIQLLHSQEKKTICSCKQPKVHLATFTGKKE